MYLLGQKIGKVERVEIVEHTETEPTRVRATLGFPERYWKHMTRDAKILIDKSITGNLTVIILGLDGEPLQPRRPNGRGAAERGVRGDPGRLAPRPGRAAARAAASDNNLI